MPGLIGFVGKNRRPHAMSSAALALQHLSEYCNRQSTPFQDFSIAQIWRNPKETSGSWHNDGASGVSTFVNGTVIVPGDQPRQLNAQDVLAAYLNKSLAPESYDGSFVICIGDERSRKVIIFNDRLGTLPCYYYSNSISFCFAPEAKAIFKLNGEIPGYSTSGIVTFLALGYCLSDTTLFDGIQFMEPGTRLTIDVPTATYEKSRYWKLHFNPSPFLRSRRRAEEVLYEAILSGHRATFFDPDEQYDMLLSGGWDSRGMLAFANELGRLPQRSISWGLRDDVPGSDPYLAAQLAAQFRLSHHFISYDTDSFVKNADQWSYLTELSTDNFGWYGEGTDLLLSEYVGRSDYIVAGDENWGTGNYVRSREEAMITRFMPSPLPYTVANCLSVRIRSDADAIYMEEIDKLLRCCDNTNWNDRKDFLYLHGRLARFIFSLGYYKEFAVEVRRPFLSTHVLDVVERLPNRMRYGKNLYISTMIRFFPELLQVNKRWADSLPKWRRDLHSNTDLSRYFSELLNTQTLANSGISTYLDVEEVNKVASRFFFTPYQEKQGRRDRSARQGKLVNSIKQRIMAYDDVRQKLHLQNARKQKFDDLDLLRRVALLVLLDRNLMSMNRPTSR